MAAGYTIRVEGLAELQRALRQADRLVLKEVKGELRKVGDVVKDDATSRGSRYAGIGPYKTIVYSKEVVVRQSKNKVTGQRGDFAALQMRNVLEPALAAKEGDVVNMLENVIDALPGKVGL